MGDRIGEGLQVVVSALKVGRPEAELGLEAVALGDVAGDRRRTDQAMPVVPDWGDRQGDREDRPVFALPEGLA